MSEQQFLKMMSALSDGNRLKIVYILYHQKFCAMHIQILLNVSQSNVSRHVEKLINSGIVVSFKRGRRIIYELSPDFIENNQELLTQIEKIYCDQINKDELLAFGMECENMKKDNI